MATDAEDFVGQLMDITVAIAKRAGPVLDVGCNDPNLYYYILCHLYQTVLMWVRSEKEEDSMYAMSLWNNQKTWTGKIGFRVAPDGGVLLNPRHRNQRVMIFSVNIKQSSFYVEFGKNKPEGYAKTPYKILEDLRTTVLMFNPQIPVRQWSAEQNVAFLEQLIQLAKVAQQIAYIDELQKIAKQKQQQEQQQEQQHQQALPRPNPLPQPSPDSTSSPSSDDSIEVIVID